MREGEEEGEGERREGRERGEREGGERGDGEGERRGGEGKGERMVRERERERGWRGMQLKKGIDLHATYRVQCRLSSVLTLVWGPPKVA